MDARLDTGGIIAVFVNLTLICLALTGAQPLVRRRVLGWMPAEEAHKTVSA
jgi:hypothetical protein